MKLNETIRKDGLRIISCFVPNKKTVLVELVARVGYAYDPPDKPGLFHTFEHMAFKGTKKRTAKELSSFAARNLFNSNASTGALGTTYKATVIDRKLPLACEYLCDIYFNSTLPSTELEKEKRPILLEIARRNDSDIGMAAQALYECLYRENPLRRDGGGTVAGMARIHRADLIEQKNKWHTPSNTIAIAIGNINHRDFVKEISKHIPPSLKKISLSQWTDEASEPPLKKEVTIKRPKREKSILLLGCKIPRDLDTKTNEAFSLYSKFIGGGSNSPLWHEIRERRGLAYVVQGSYSGISGLGNIFSVYAEIHPSKSEQVERLIWRTLMKPLSDKVKFEEMRERMFDAFEIFTVEDNELEHIEGRIWRHITEGRSVKNVAGENKKRLKIISRLSLKDLEAVRKQFIHPECFARVLLEPN